MSLLLLPFFTINVQLQVLGVLLVMQYLLYSTRLLTTLYIHSHNNIYMLLLHMPESEGRDVLFNDTLNTFYDTFNTFYDTLNTFYLQLYGNRYNC